LIALVEVGALALDVAVGTVDLICANNPYITPLIVSDFRRLAGEADQRRRAMQEGPTWPELPAPSRPDSGRLTLASSLLERSCVLLM